MAIRMAFLPDHLCEPDEGSFWLLVALFRLCYESFVFCCTYNPPRFGLQPQVLQGESEKGYKDPSKQTWSQPFDPEHGWSEAMADPEQQWADVGALL